MFLLPAFLFLSPSSASANNQAISREFQRVARNIIIGVEVVARQRPYKLSAYNNSLEKLGRAAKAMGRGNDPRSALKFLNQAQKEYKQNSFVPFF